MKESRDEKRAPKISVIMSIYNQRNSGYLDQAVMSILNQTFGDLEFIIYDDGSDAAVCRQLEKYEQLDDRITLIHSHENCGLAYSLNTCINVARGKYLARMDDDDISDPERLAVQYEYMENHPEIAYVGCNARLIDSRGVWGHRVMPEFPMKHSFLRYSPFIHPSVMIRRSIFDTQEAYRFSKDTWRCEDYELFMRLMRLGYRGGNIQQELFCYREDADSYRKRKFKYRIDEMKLRYRNFKDLGLLYPIGWLYVARPLAAAIVPSRLTYMAKKLYHRQPRVENSGEEVLALSGPLYAQRGM
ncbi:MAG: glycosyltransferase [Eubacterium sp.]|nr:glycosyltransferase [Eubacterium sp.]MCM1214429.1 glycosyltransferase [Lachnospiraceae bacterium]MCM1238719.1 glycosyltransferase [Lachnospiraceae bacterium]MCM1342628.1 glycosyltransferase [Muribaculaceae bacterium]MCM1409740.1 glycosyltransferase [Lachnospiraceae bacterium]